MTPPLVAATAVAVAALLAAERSRAPWRLPIKAAASTGFVVTAIAAGALDSAYGKWVLAALCLGWIGDVALVPSGRSWFLVGLVAFLVSHLAYIGAFESLRIDLWWMVAATAALGLAATVVARWLWPHVASPMRGPVLAYIVVITVMLAAAVAVATNEAPWPVLPAAAGFYLSDLAVARDRFVKPGFPNRAWGLPLYYGAQILFALSTGMV